MQTFTFEGMPEGVALETLTFEDLGDGRTRLHAQSLVDSFEARDAWLSSGMEVGVNEGYAKLTDARRWHCLTCRRTGRADDSPAPGTAGTPARSPTGSAAPATGTAPAPVAGWTARDVVRHLVEWFPGSSPAAAA